MRLAWAFFLTAILPAVSSINPATAQISGQPVPGHSVGTHSIALMDSTFDLEHDPIKLDRVML